MMKEVAQDGEVNFSKIVKISDCYVTFKVDTLKVKIQVNSDELS
jgi:hypothetical protein